MQLQYRTVMSNDRIRLEAIRSAAFAPVFASFKHILGDDIYHLAQEREDLAQADELTAMLNHDSPWRVVGVETVQKVVVSLAYLCDTSTQGGELVLTAVHTGLSRHCTDAMM